MGEQLKRKVCNKNGVNDAQRVSRGCGKNSAVLSFEDTAAANVLSDAALLRIALPLIASQAAARGRKRAD